MSAESLPNIPGYRLLERIASGGMGTVYRAQAGLLEKPQAVKLLHAELAHDPAFRKRFLSEANLIATFSHPGLLRVHHAGDADGILYIATEFCPGGTLREAYPYPVPVEAALKLMKEIAAPLAVLHKGNVVHRDLKPENVLIDENGRLRIADFGIAKPLNVGPSTMTQQGCIIGTLDYMSPEQLAGVQSIDGRSDIFTLGIMLYEMIEGVRPFVAYTPYDMALAHSQKMRPVSRKADARVSQLIEIMLARDVEQRPATCEFLISEIDRILGMPRTATPPATAQTPGYSTKIIELDPKSSASKPGPVEDPGRASAPPRVQTGLMFRWVLSLTGLAGIAVMLFMYLGSSEPESVAAASTPVSPVPEVVEPNVSTTRADDSPMPTERELVLALIRGTESDISRVLAPGPEESPESRRVRQRVEAVVKRLSSAFGAPPWSDSTQGLIKERLIQDARQLLAAAQVGLPFPPGENAVDLLRVLLAMEPTNAEATRLYNNILNDYRSAMAAAERSGNQSAVKRIAEYQDYANQPELDLPVR